MQFLRKCSILLALLPAAIVIAMWFVARRIQTDEAKLLIEAVGTLIAAISAGLYILQWFEERKPIYEFGLRAANRTAIFWISNHGRAPLTVTAFVARTEDSERREDTSLTLKEGDRQEINLWPLLQQLADGADPWFDFDAWFEYSSRGRKGTASSQPFNVFSAHGEVISAGRGYVGYSNVKCPKCCLPAAFKMEGLQRLNRVARRKRKVERGLRASCPKHKANWLLTPKDVGLVGDDRFEPS